ncbi:histone acetyltransferase PWA37_004129 [Arxiozyma heterogenica]|uniref:histone acetyltransferase n=1 Tax=Arxiozyma heterogenica TaxID=278026 RepID=UPI002F215504
MNISFGNNSNHLKKSELSNELNSNSNFDSNSNQLHVKRSQDVSSVNQNITIFNNSNNNNTNNNNNDNVRNDSGIVPPIMLQQEPIVEKKRGRGRPRKYPLAKDVIIQNITSIGINKKHLNTLDTIKVDKIQKVRYKRGYKSKSKSKSKSAAKSSKFYKNINNYNRSVIGRKKLEDRENNMKGDVRGERGGEEQDEEQEQEEIYGILEERNIKQVQFGLDKLFPTWYGSAVYFDKETRQLGIYPSKNDGIFTNNINTKVIKSQIINYGKADNVSYIDHSLLVTNSDKEDQNNNIESAIECFKEKEKEKEKDGVNNEINNFNKNIINDKDKDRNEDKTDSIWLDTLYVCEYCFKYTNNSNDLKIHDSMCRYKLNNPSGKIKYRSPEYTIRRVKGYKEKLFCQCLCLFTKLFLDNKSTYFKVENYEFYILYKTNGRKPMAFFSKDVISYNQNNLACILTFPPYQRKRLGSLLIEFSYKLSRSQDLISGPEFPLSPFGLVGYINYWAKTICWHLLDGDLNHLTSISIKDISLVTGFRISDIIMTLNYLNCIDMEKGTINISQIKYWINSRNEKNGHFMLEDEYLMISD